VRSCFPKGAVQRDESGWKSVHWKVFIKGTDTVQRDGSGWN
jgi:hypothetical protein